MLVKSIYEEARKLFGVDASDIHLMPTDWIASIVWACSVLNKQLRICMNDTRVGRGHPFMGDTDYFLLPNDSIEIVTVILQGRKVKLLYKTEYQSLVQRRPDWSSTQKPARFWAFIEGNAIVLDGSNNNGIVEIHYLQQPANIVGLDSDIDNRFNALNPMAFAYLAAAYCLQIAGDAASLEKARIYFREGMSLAGVKTRVEMPITNSGGERATQAE